MKKIIFVFITLFFSCLSSAANVMPADRTIANQVGQLVDQSVSEKMQQCLGAGELSSNGCMAYGSNAYANAFSRAGYSYRDTIVKAATDANFMVNYNALRIDAFFMPTIAALKSEDGTNLLVKLKVIKNSDIETIRKGFSVRNSNHSGQGIEGMRR